MARSEFTRTTQNMAIFRQRYKCGMCGINIKTNSVTYAFHHIKRCKDGGTRSLDNCVMLCTSGDNCHHYVHNYGRYRQPIELDKSEYEYFD